MGNTPAEIARVSLKPLGDANAPEKMGDALFLARQADPAPAAIRLPVLFAGFMLLSGEYFAHIFAFCADFTE